MHYLYIEITMYNRLRVLRAERCWSQATLAEALGVSRQTVNAIEVGKFDPSLPLAFAIARVFEQRIEDVFDPDKKVRAHNQTQVSEFTPSLKDGT
jgi:putative transcriptional regulator